MMMIRVQYFSQELGSPVVHGIQNEASAIYWMESINNPDGL